MKLIKEYRSSVEKELSDICEAIHKLLDNALIPEAKTGESKVFYYKMKGDYHRYYAEIDTKDVQKNAALDAYQKASDIANTSLSPTHPIRLGLALNFSVFYYEILKNPEKYVVTVVQSCTSE